MPILAELVDKNHDWERAGTSRIRRFGCQRHAIGCCNLHCWRRCCIPIRDLAVGHKVDVKCEREKDDDKHHPESDDRGSGFFGEEPGGSGCNVFRALFRCHAETIALKWPNHRKEGRKWTDCAYPLDKLSNF